MEVVVTSLEALIQRATNAVLDHPEPAAIDAFCAVFSDAADGPLLATKVIAARIQSQNSKESLLALQMLEKCMRRCGPSFHAEVGKFRFLNEMIKLVSPKYYAARTSPDVRLKVICFLRAWAFEYPHETKFKVAYDMLKNQGVVKVVSPLMESENRPVCIPRPVRQGIFEDEEKSKMLQKLLQSRNADDIQAANRLIKNMVREEERRAEVTSRLATEVSSALACARLLAELLQHAQDAGADDRALMDELHLACRKHHSALTAAAKDTNRNDMALGEILSASDELSHVFDKYKALIVDGNTGDYKITNVSSHSEQVANTEVSSLLDLANENAPPASNAIQASSTVATLSDIFLGKTVSPPSPLMLQPLTMPTTQLEDNIENTMNKGISALESLGDDLLKESLSTSYTNDTFIRKNSNTKKIPMNALDKSSKDLLLPDTNLSNSTKNETLDLDFLIGKSMNDVKVTNTTSAKPIESSDDLMVDITMDTNLLMDINNKIIETIASTLLDSSSQNESGNSVQSVGDSVVIGTTCSQNNKETDSPPIETKNPVQRDAKDLKTKNMEIKALTDINVSLQSITASKRAPVCMYADDNGVSVTLHFSKDKPRADVWVMVVTTTSKSAEQIEDFKFHAVVPKGCKVRLLPASGTSLAAHNPFLPPPAITQLLLLGAPASAPATTPQVCLKFVLTYDLHDESVSEIGEIKLGLEDE